MLGPASIPMSVVMTYKVDPCSLMAWQASAKIYRPQARNSGINIWKVSVLEATRQWKSNQNRQTATGRNRYNVKTIRNRRYFRKLLFPNRLPMLRKKSAYIFC